MLRSTAILLLLASTASATEPYCQIWNKGSGCLIAVNKEGVADILTCAHGYKARETVAIRFRSTKKWIEGSVTAIDVDLDLAIVQIVVPEAINYFRPVPLASTAPESGDVTIYGYGKREFYEHRTKVIGKQTANVKTLTRRDFYRVQGSSRPGDSGAAVLSHGRLVGVNVAKLDQGNDGLFVPVEDVNAFLVDKAGWKRE